MAELLLVAEVHGLAAPCFCAVLDCGNGYCCVEIARVLRDAPAAALDSSALPHVSEADVLGFGAPCFCAVLDCGNGYRCVEVARVLRDAPAAALDSSALPRVTEALEPVADGAEGSLSTNFENRSCNIKG